MIPPSGTVSNAGIDPSGTVDPLPTLLLDPDPEAAAMMASQLRHGDFETYIAANGPSALLAARRMHFGAIVVVADLASNAMCNTSRCTPGSNNRTGNFISAILQPRTPFAAELVLVDPE
jgi:CheY-like chemotaxis protein